MTRFVLHGGETSVSNVHNKNFYREMVKAAKGKPILVCYYSRPLKEQKYLLKSEVERIKSAVGQKEFEVVVASKIPQEFLKQLKKSEVVYFRGGNTVKLMKRLEVIKGDLKRAFWGKTVMGSSAGAIMLARYFYNQDGDKIFKGFDLLPIKVMTHYLSTGKYASLSGKDKLDMLKKYKEKLPIYAIKETEFKIIKK